MGRGAKRPGFSAPAGQALIKFSATFPLSGSHLFLTELTDETGDKRKFWTTVIQKRSPVGTTVEQLATPKKKGASKGSNGAGAGVGERAVAADASKRATELLDSFQELLDLEGGDDVDGLHSVFSLVLKGMLEPVALEPFISFRVKGKNKEEDVDPRELAFEDEELTAAAVPAFRAALKKLTVPKPRPLAGSSAWAQAQAQQPDDGIIVPADVLSSVYLQEISENRCSNHGLGQWHTDCWIKADRELGPLARFLCILAVLRGAHPDDWFGILSAHWSSTGRLEATTAEFRKLLSVDAKDGIRDGAKYLESNDVSAAVMTALNDFRARSALPPLRFQDIHGAQLGPLHKGSLMDFKLWLRFGLWRCAHVAALLPPAQPNGLEQLDPLVEEVRGALLGDKPQRPIVLLHSLERPKLLRMIAAQALNEPLKTLWPRPNQWSVVALRANDGDDRNFEWTMRQFLTPLSKALNVPLWSPSRPPTPEQVEACLESIRQGLSRTRCIITVENLQTAGRTRYAPLFDFLSGQSQVQDLVRSLALPWFGQCRPDSVSRAETNGVTRILVLCNQPCQALEPLSHKCISADAFFSTTPGLAKLYPSELVQAIESANLRLGLKEQAAAETPREAMRRLVRQLHGEAGNRDKTEWLLLLAFIAVVPDGIFAVSLQRLFDLWWQIVVANPLKSELDFEVIRQRICDAIETLMARSAPAGTGGSPRASTDTISSGQAQLAAQDFVEIEGGFVHCVRGILSVDVEQVTEGLAERHLQWEVGTLQASGGSRHASDSEGHNRGVYRRRISFANILARDLFIEEFRALSEIDMGAKYGLCLAGERTWKILQFASAGECLRQSTALLRNSTSAELRSLSRHRRMIQCVSHVAAAGDMRGITFPGAGDDAVDHQRLLLPLDPHHRLWFAVAILYSRVIERNVWRLSRNWSRSELRTALLLLLVISGHEPRAVVVGAPRSVLEHGAVLPPPTWDAVEAAEARQRGEGSDRAVHELGERLAQHLLAPRWGQPPTSLVTAARARSILSNLAHAAIDAEDRVLAAMANQLLRKLSSPHASFLSHVVAIDAPIVGRSRLRGAKFNMNLMLSMDAGRSTNFDLDKTAFDVAEIGGHDLGTALAICESFIGSFHGGIYRKPLERAVAATQTALLNAADDETQPFRLQRVQGAIRAHLAEFQLLGDSRQLNGFVDMLFRRASALSSKADHERDGVFAAQPERAIGSMALAWSTFHIADVLRGMVAHLGSADSPDAPLYGMVTTRSWRAGVRATLALARMLVKYSGAASSDPQRDNRLQAADFLFEYARARCDILVRDSYQSDRERVYATLLQCGVVRAISCADFDRRTPADFDDNIGLALDDPLLDAVAYVGSGERRLLALGAPLGLLPRMVVERIQTLGALFQRTSTTDGQDRDKRARSIHAVVESMLRQDLLILEGLSHGSFFFHRLYVQLLNRFTKAGGTL